MALSDSIKKAWSDERLFSALLELTYRCNLDCFFCYNDLGLEGKSVSLERYRSLLDELADLGALNLILSGGEPLAHPHFFDIGAHARERGFVVRIKSNGHALQEKLAGKIKRVIDPFLIEVSLHGATGEVHDRQTRVPGSFDKLMANLTVLRALDIRVKVNATLTAWNEHQIEAMYDLAQHRGLFLQFDSDVTPRDDGDDSPLAIAPSKQGMAHLFRIQRARAQANGGGAEQVPVRLPAGVPAAPRRETAKHCGAGSSTLAVDPFGTVFPCVQYRRPIGNIHDQSMAEIWNGHNQALGEIRQENIEVARLAKDESLIAYCPGSATARSGSALTVPESVRQRKKIFDAVMAE